MEETENWTIDYDLECQSVGEVERQSEELHCVKGYHARLKEWYGEQETPGEERSPIYKIRERDGGTHIELLGIEGGRTFLLPLDDELRARGGTVMCSEKHPIKLVAPDGTEYVRDII